MLSLDRFPTPVALGTGFLPLTDMLLALDELPLPAWAWIRQDRWFVLDPGPQQRPGGPVIFTSQAHAHRFATEAAARGLDLTGAELRPLSGGLHGVLRTWRGLFRGLGYAPDRYCVVLVNPRQALHPGQDWDGGAVAFDPQMLPEGVLQANLGWFDPLEEPR